MDDLKRATSYSRPLAMAKISAKNVSCLSKPVKSSKFGLETDLVAPH